MRRALLAATALSTSVLFLIPTAASAQSTFDWTGFYAGVLVGGSASNSTLSFDYPPTGFYTPLESGTFQSSGSTVGATAGYNWQAGNVLVGLEADVTALALSGSLLGTNYTADERLNSLLSTRARLGLVYDRFVVYGTAGLAAGQASFSTDVGKGDPVTGTGVVTGTVVGAGVEVALNDKISARIGAKTYNLSSLSAVGDDGKGDSYTANYQPRPTVFEAGLNVHF